VILVDSSVWIANLRGTASDAVAKLRGIDPARTPILVGDLILMEVLMGCRDEGQAARVRRDMGQFDIVPISSPDIAVDAARDYRTLRGLGVTIRGGIDMLIGTFCVRRGYTLLHDDRDFVAMERHLGLKVL